MDIVKHIEHLLLGNDCVVVPGLGAFICHDVASVCSDGILMPPSRRVSFNSAVNQSDGLLADFVARTEGCGYALAANKVDSEVGMLKERLRNGESVEIGRIGILKFAATGCLTFIPHSDSLIGNLSNFGLPVVDMRQREREKAGIPQHKEGRLARIRRNALRVAASVAAIVVMALTLTTPITVDSLPDKASVAPVAIKTKPTKEQKSCTSTACSVPLSERKQPEKAAVGKAERYSVVIASLSSYRQAQKYKTESEEQGLVIIDAAPGSRVYKVALASGSSREEMEKLIEDKKIKEKYPDVWICRN